MKYCSAYLWGKGKETSNSVSLVLQQVRVAKQAVVLGCVCGAQMEVEFEEIKGEKYGEVEINMSGRFTEALVEWFHRECLGLLEKKWSEEELEKSLHKEVTEVMEEIENYRQKMHVEAHLEFAGILMVEQWFCLFGSGNMQVFLVNRRFNRKHLRCIAGGAKYIAAESEVTGARKENNRTKMHWQCGEVQKKIGLLLCTEGFVEEMEVEDVAETLTMDGELKEARLEKRLRELWEARQDKTRDAAAVYIRTY